MFTVDVENQTDFFGAFALARLTDGKTIDDLMPHLAQAQRQFDESGGMPPPPPSALGVLADDLPTWRVYVAEQLDVAE